MENKKEPSKAKAKKFCIFYVIKPLDSNFTLYFDKFIMKNLSFELDNVLLVANDFEYRQLKRFSQNQFQIIL